ncbi:hypothetical protein F511_24113 [Dorcoceras hygrometricum]|uniref:Uncharacterized protein n=1 Tax=Dorcoceras hygrometricum TaxID=472368 RepID=A0A2Z7ADT3_9LAMI|nr:hypothetical protein F511_24113 [Dorcoceras hygrometricum]
MNFVKASVIHDVCESVKYDDQFTGQLNYKGENGIGYIKPENCKPNWLTNRLEKDKAKAVPKSFVLNQQRRGSTKAKWIKRSNHDACIAIRFKKIRVTPLPPAIAFGKARSLLPFPDRRSYPQQDSSTH